MTDAGWSTWPAPAKLNLFLHVVGRRSDGYHLLQTCFQLVDWGDELRLRIRQDGLIRHTEPVCGIAADGELCLRAAAALRRATGCRPGVDIALKKRIPVGGGLGGGSSDAATVLVVLNALWATGLEQEALCELALGLGADVPLFVRGRSAWAEGVGEVLTPIDLPERWYLLVDPGIRVSSAELFGAGQLTRNAAPLTIPRFISGADTGNAFEPLVRERFPEVARAFDWLGRHGDAGMGAPRLTGSGSCAFLPLISHAAGQGLLAQCPPDMRCHLVRGVTRSPLFDRLDSWNQDTISIGASPSW
ncbi:MAG TPA: 4-(cytidine 5'-diphospho)-2-C-methyl-D-erythritol kinase [Rhodanobacteraceae bacterium]|nr:4-(cytidine 5'-diphospho)-2-C-methyl-D-erythritol kinase [Rhodanobacteraceae bacterium]